MNIKKSILIGAGILAVLPTLPAIADAKGGLARAEEIVAGRCFLCHGMEGESLSPVFPRLAGQNAEYLARQLADFKSGKRKSETMKPQSEELTAAEMKALGTFFEKKKASAHTPDDTEVVPVGRYIFMKGNPYSGLPSCASCHGPKGLGTTQLPRLAGQHPRYIEDQLKQFNKRERTNDNAVMHTIASKLTELEAHAVAEYISTLE